MLNTVRGSMASSDHNTYAPVPKMLLDLHSTSSCKMFACQLGVFPQPQQSL